MLKPQPGFQEAALATQADVAIIGGSAGGGKTFLELMESTRHVSNPDFGAVIFRRTTNQITNEGGLWDTSLKVYPQVGGEPKESKLSWIFESGARVKMAHLEYDKNAHDWQGAQIPLIIFDELTHFTEYQFWYMVSRNRTNCGVKPYIRASCNPDPNSWVARLVAWYIDQQTGFPIKERAGVLRYFTRDGENIVWGDNPQEVIAKCSHIFGNQQLIDSGVEMERLIKSFTFIPGTIYENKIFIKEDPSYLGTLLSLSAEEKSRLLDGNWLVSLDGMQICDPIKLNEIYDNYPEYEDLPLKCITVDAARFGRDFCVIMYWEGWEVKYMVVMKQSDAFDIKREIEKLRKRFSVSRDNVVVDQDGVGDGTIKIGGYAGFHGGATPVKDPKTRIKENYENYKTQCYYRFCENRVNKGQVRFSINNETCLIFDGSYKNGKLDTKIKIGTAVRDVRDLIKEDFRSVRRLETKNEGVDKIKMEPKEKQKEVLGRSPDFGDCAMMREHLELRHTKKSFKQVNKTY